VTSDDRHDHSTRHRRATFDEVATLYDSVRPGYPAELYDDIRTLSGVPNGGNILEIGCGTGQATLPLAQRGYRITCVELGAELAALARRNLAAYPNVEVRIGAFEAESLPEAAFDLVVSATAFHWVAPESYPKLARVLRPEGAIALFWNKHIAGAVDGGFFDRIQPIYREHVPEFAGDWKGLPSADEVSDESAALAATGLFGPFTVKRYPWVAHYGAERYVNLLNTYSDFLALPADRRQRAYDDIARVIDGEFGGQIAMQYLAILYVAQVL
jgi:SAM-dependent methyltransferase